MKIEITQFIQKVQIKSFLFVLFGMLLLNLSCNDEENIMPVISPPENAVNFEASEGDRKVTLSWTAQENVVGYKLTFTPDGLEPIFLRRELTSYEILPLTNDVEYEFTLFSAKGERDPFVYSSGTSITSTPIAPPKLASFSEDFNESCPDGLPEGWTSFSEDSNKDWTCSGANDLQVNGYGGDTPSKDWLITPAFELSEVNIAELSFDYFAKWGDVAGFGLDARISLDYSGFGDPTVATWTSLDAGIDNTRNSSDFSNSTVSLSSYSGRSVYIAFYYSSSGTGGGQSIQIGVDNIGVKGPLLVENFDTTCPNLPDFWTNFSENSNKDWHCADENGGDFAFEVNAYGGDEPSKDWLITPVIELPADNDIDLTFDYFAKWGDAVGNGLDVKISTDYSGSGDPTSATWTSLSAGIDNTMNSSDYTSSSVSLSSYSGEVYIAFFYSSSGTGGGQSLQIRVDNIKIK